MALNVEGVRLVGLDLLADGNAFCVVAGYNAKRFECIAATFQDAIDGAILRALGKERKQPAIGKPCPFCGGVVDPEGWASTDDFYGIVVKHGPACDDCGASAPTLEDWNRRVSS